MRFRETKLPGAFVIEPAPVEDERGHFARMFCRREFEAHGLVGDFVQTNLSYNRNAGTLRGMHFQTPPHAETKVVRCNRGALYDVIVDLRPASPAFRRWEAFELTDRNGLMLYVPAGFAHGFQTLRDETEVLYLMSEYHVPGHASGVRWDDPAFSIEWPSASRRIVSSKDLAYPNFDLACDRR